MLAEIKHRKSQEQSRVQAVLALFRREKASDVSTSSGICRSDLYKFRKRALAAMREALKDHLRGPKRPVVYLYLADNWYGPVRSR
jgi:hypothetical protein